LNGLRLGWARFQLVFTIRRLKSWAGDDRWG
jgi:hypothetical protein